MNYDLNGMLFEDATHHRLLKSCCSLPCRRRRRFDPSIQCEYPADTGDLSDSHAAPSTSTTQDTEISSTATTALTPSLARSPNITINDQFLLNHIATICIDLEDTGGHLWTSGLAILVESVLS